MQKKQVLMNAIATAVLDAADAMPDPDAKLIREVEQYAALLNHKVTVEFFHCVNTLGLDAPKYINFRYVCSDTRSIRFSLGYNYKTRLWSLRDTEKLTDSGFVLFDMDNKYAKHPDQFLSYILQHNAEFHSALIGG